MTEAEKWTALQKAHPAAVVEVEELVYGKLEWRFTRFPLVRWVNHRLIQYSPAPWNTRDWIDAKADGHYTVKTDKFYAALSDLGTHYSFLQIEEVYYRGQAIKPVKLVAEVIAYWQGGAEQRVKFPTPPPAETTEDRQVQEASRVVTMERDYE